MQQPTGDGMPDYRLQFVHGTRFGGIRGYGMEWKVRHHTLIKYQKGKRYIYDRMVGGRPRMIGTIISGPGVKEKGRGKKRKGKHRSSIEHNASRGGPENLKHGMVTDVGPAESMWGHIRYPDRAVRNRRHRRSYGAMYRNFNRHDAKRRLQIASATPRTYVNNKEFESQYMGNIRY